VPRSLSLLSIVALAAITADLSAQNRYRIRKLTCPGLAHGVAWSIDDEGTIVGEMLDTSGRSRAVRWREGVGAQLPGVNGSEVGVAYQTGRSGAIAGATGLGTSRTSATVWMQGNGEGPRVADLGAVTGAFLSAALAVDGSRAVGYVDDGLTSTPVMWSDIWSTPTHRTLPLPGWAFAGEAIGMLDRETVVGFGADFSSVRPLLWRIDGDGVVVEELPTAGGWGRVNGVQDRVAVGVVWSAQTGSANLATWSDGQLHDLGHLPGTDCYGQAVNRGGDVVGYAQTYSSPAYVGVLKRRGQPVVDLNDLLPPGSGWTIARALDIADDGTIIGTGIYEGFFEPFVMTPEGTVLDAPAPGVAGATNAFTANGASPLGSVIYCVALQSGEAPIPGCAAKLGLASPLVFGVIAADSGGRASFPVFVPSELSGLPLWFQAYDYEACGPSNLVKFTFE